MNYCPNCGTANRDGSRFCNECGHKMPSKTGIICPMCNHVNPNDNVYCDNCKARLVPAAPPAAQPGAPAPAAPAAAPIKGLSLPVKPADEPTPAVEAQAESEVEGDETPDWLVRLRAAAPKASEVRSEAPAQPPTQSLPPVEDMPEWMRPADSDVPDWFQRLSEPTPAEPTAPPPSPSGSPDLHPFETSASAGPVEEELPDWMRDLGLAPPAPVEPPPAPAPADESEPEWLAQMISPAAPPTQPEPEADVPDWLSTLNAAPSAPTTETDVPDWLSQIQGEVGTPAPPAEPAMPEPAAGADELDWISSLRAEPEAPIQEPPSSEPDWLSAIGAQPAAPLAGEEPSAETPDWLAGLRDQPAPQVSAAEPIDEAPDWLAGLRDETQIDSTAAEPAAPADVPDWLMGMTASPADQPLAEAEAALPPSEEVPDWLRDIGPSQAAPPPTMGEGRPAAEDLTSPPLAGAIGAFLGADVGVEEPAETPAWLSDIGTPPPAAPSPAQDAAPVEIPAWLRDLGPMPTAPAQPEGTPFGETAPALQGEIPEWLRGMQPGQATPAFADESGRSLAGIMDQAAAPEAGLEAATIPSWLQALRPTETTGPLAEPAGGIVETEGMLAELQNVLPASAFMGQSHGVAAMRQIQVPAADLARAGLFQELLSRGALAPTIVKPSRGRAARLSERVARWLIAVVLIVAVAVPNGSNLVQSFFKLSDVNPAVYKPVSDQIGSLQAGDRVLVAFDYDAFQAGEMDAVAQALLTHIRQRDADVLAVSLGPTGLALADRVSEQLGLTGAPPPIAGEGGPFIDRRYLPGQAAGAQSALIAAQTDPFDLIVVLAGSPDALRWWIEQATLSGAPTPIVAGVSAGALPQAQLYTQSAQVKGIVVGMIGGLAYLRSMDTQPDVDDADGLDRKIRSEALYLSQLVFAAILIIGAVVSLVAGTRRG